VAETAAYNTMHHHYGLLAGRIMVRKLYKKTPQTFKECVEILYNLKAQDGN